MRISTKGRYSLEALLYLALSPDKEYASTKSIAERTGLSDGYLEQLFISLRKARLIKGVRGPQGGCKLAKAPERITVGDILRAAEGRLEPVDCIKSKVCPLRKTCLSRHTWQELYDEINTCADSITLGELVSTYQTMDLMEYTI
jgi:Rrf2 family protein